MGLFSSSYKYYAYVGSDNLFDEDNRPNTVLSLMLSGILGGTASPSDAIIIGLNTNLYSRARSMHKYAAKEGGYIWGFPETNQLVYNITQDLLRPYIEADAGGPIDFRTTGWENYAGSIIIRNFFLEAEINANYTNTAYFPWDGVLGLPADTNWSPVDDEIEIPIVVPGVIPDPDTYETSNNQFGAVITGDSYQVSFPYSGGNWDVAQPFNLAPYNQPGTWITVRYRMVGGGDQYLYWYYLIGSGGIPALDNEIEADQVNMEYLPIAILMHDTVWFDEAGNQEWEDTLDRLLRDIALDPYDIKEDYLEQQALDDASGDENRSNAEDWDFFILFGVPLKTDFRGGREYLFHFYRYLQRTTWTTFAQYEAYVAGGQFGAQPASSLIVEEGEQYTGYIARYAWSYITEITVAGPFTPPGWFDPLRPRRLWSETYALGDSDYNEGLNLVHGPGNYSVALTQGEEQEHSYTIVTRMNEDNTHTHILMMGPSMEYQINTSQEPIGVGAGGYVDYRYRFVDMELFPEDPEEVSEFRWPVHMASLKEVSAMQREAALADGLCATVFLVDKIKVKWYQKSFFKWLIIIIAIIVIVVFWQYELLPAVAAAAGAATGAAAIGLWALYVVMVFAVGFLISFAGSLIGGNLGTLFVIVGMYMSAGGSLAAGNPFAQMGTAWSNLATAPGWGSAIQFIQAVYPAISTGQTIYSEYHLAKLEGEMRDFTKTAKEKYEQLQDAWDSLQETPSWVNPMDLVRTFSTNGLFEDPESFYYRTLHANPGTLGYDLIESFTEMALLLPQRPGSPGIVDSMMKQFADQRGQT